MATMHTPPHPGEILREWLGDMSVTDAAQHLGVARATLSRVLNGSSGISADMALRLHAALRTSPEMWRDYRTIMSCGKQRKTSARVLRHFHWQHD